MAAVAQAVGALVSVVWTVVGLLYLSTSGPQLPNLSPAALRDLLAKEAGAIAFFWLALGYIWLVVGYFYQQSLIRRNSTALNKAVSNAAAALELVEQESHKQRHYQLSRIRAAQPRWEVAGCIAHRGQTEISLRNLGAPASQLSIWTRDLPVVAMLSTATFVDRGQDLTIKVVFKAATLEEFEFALEYRDSAGAERVAQVLVSTTGITVRQEEF